MCEAYNFLASNYCDGDEVFFFGFSRGAYTARACAGLVANVGLCKDIQMSRFWEMYSVYKSKPRGTLIGDTDWGKKNDTIAVKDDKDMKPEDWITISKGDKNMAPYAVRKGAGAGWLEFCKKPVIKVVGVFDTVGSLGYPKNIFVDVSKWNEPYQFHDTDIHPGGYITRLNASEMLKLRATEIENAFHALALDERRAPFSPTLWNLPVDNKETDDSKNTGDKKETDDSKKTGDNKKPGGNKKTNLIQCWFPGIHVNIGGGSSDGLKKTPKGDLESMANTTFAWMVDRCRPFLHFDDKVLLFIIDKYYKTLETLTDRELKSGSHSEKETVGWGVGLNHAGMVENAHKGLMTTIGGVEDRTPGHYPNKSDSNEFIHPVVFHAQDEQGYVSRALEGFKRVPGKGEDAQGKGHVWVKTYTKQEAENWKESWSGWVGSLFNRRTIKKTEESVTITLPEFVIPKMVVQQNSKAPGRYYANPLERLLIIRDLWTEEQTRQAFESEDSFVHRKDNILAKQTQNDYLMKLDEDNKGTEYIGKNVAWGTPVQDEPKA